MNSRPAYDRWRDARGVHISDGARVEQVKVAKEHGALSHRVGKRAEVIGRSQSNRLRVRFDGEDKPVSIRPHLVRVVTADGIVEELVQLQCDMPVANRSPGEGTR
ncbi:MAG: hypothetical protein WAN20_04010 [Pseudonocardiaceae bacterium]